MADGVYLHCSVISSTSKEDFVVRFKIDGKSFVFSETMHTEQRLAMKFDLTFSPG